MSKCRLAPSALEALPAVETAIFGWNVRIEQFAAWNGSLTAWVAPSQLSIAPVISSRAQLVGLIVNAGRVIVTLVCLMFSPKPSITRGIALVVPVIAAVSGLISLFARTTTGLPSCRSNGPALAGFTMLRPNGAPAYFSVRYTFPPVTVNGSPPTPTLTTVSPINDSAPHEPAFAWASPHNGTPFSIPETPGG